MIFKVFLYCTAHVFFMQECCKHLFILTFYRTNTFFSSFLIKYFFIFLTKNSIYFQFLNLIYHIFICAQIIGKLIKRDILLAVTSE